MRRIMVRSAVPLLVAWIALWGLMALLRTQVRAEGNSSLSQTLTVAAGWDGSERDGFLAMLDEFTNRTGIPTSYTQSSDTWSHRDQLLTCTASGTCPDAAVVAPHPGLLSELVSQGALVQLAPIVSDFDVYYTTTWRILASVDGALYGVPLKASSKSMIWYRPQAFDAISAAAPLTWTAVLSLCDELIAYGQTPFAIGAESGPASGWPLSDWFENILLRVGGPEIHRRLVRHDIPWTHPTVVEAMWRFRDILGRDEYQAGGITGTLNTSFLDAIDLVFGSPPSATMYFEGSWVQGVISDRHPDLSPMTDYNFFDCPEIDPAFGKPLMGSVDLVVLFHNTAEARSLAQFLASPDAAEVWAGLGGGYLSPNSGVDPSIYPDELSRIQAQQLMGASDFVYDLDDQLPRELQEHVWTAYMEFAAHQDQMMSILQGIEDKATELQGPPYEIYLPAVLKNFEL
jgi:alpha-glucoside transport system substrate-binding protein